MAYPRQTLIAFLFTCLAIPAYADTADLEGIWQDVRNSGAYFSIHINERKRMVLIELSGIELRSETLQAAYYGKIDDSNPEQPVIVLKVLDAQPYVQAQVSVVPGADNTLGLFWCANPVNDSCPFGLFTELKKIF